MLFTIKNRLCAEISFPVVKSLILGQTILSKSSFVRKTSLSFNKMKIIERICEEKRSFGMNSRIFGRIRSFMSFLSNFVIIFEKPLKKAIC